jgi:hypothetical protein
LLLVAAWHGIGSGQTPGALQTPAGGGVRPAQPSLAVQGAGSCAATACHGSVTVAARDLFPSNVLRNEHTTWLTQDRHANAYQVLLGPRSQSIARNLTGGKIPAHKDTRCLACHATEGMGAAKHPPERILRDGVGCESCHGPAERWLGPHTEYSWQQKSPAEKETVYGMRSIKTLTDRAALCVECHVGSPELDVNHDLIAAGHPRLNFEFAAFLANMPPHWYEDTRGSYPAKAWAAGQIATARAALELLSFRAGNDAQAGGNPPAPWPEFTEYNCFACHHDLTDEKWRKTRHEPGVAPGTFPWGSWSFAMTLPLAAAMPTKATAQLSQELPLLRTEMQKPAPDRKAVAKQAAELAAALDRWLHELPGDTAFSAKSIEALIGSLKSPREVSGWDEAAQLYLALQPLRQSLKDLDPAWKGADPLKATLDQMFHQLQFPTGGPDRPIYDSPRGFDPARLPDRGNR